MRRAAAKGTIGALAAMLAVLFAAPPAPAPAHSYKLAEIAIGHLWTPPDAPAGGRPVYGPLVNRGSKADRLIAARTAAPMTVGFRDGRSDPPAAVAAIELPSRRPVALAAWGFHLWIDGAGGRLEPGMTVDLTLEFRDAGAIAVQVVVEGGPSH
jgi:copper(I)-binding protein